MQQWTGKVGRTAGWIGPLALLTLSLVIGCAARSQTTNLWSDPTYTAGPMQNTFVVALRPDPVRRRLWEDAFAAELGARGVKATPSYRVFPEAAPDTQEVIAAIRQSGYDTVVVSVRLPNETQTTYVPGITRREPVTSGNYYGRFHTYWVDVQEPGHTEIDEIRRVQTDIWATGSGGRLIWSSTLNTLESSSDRTVRTAVAKDIIPLLETARLVPKRK